MTARRLTLTSILAARAVRVTHEPATHTSPARTTIEGLAYVRAVVEHDDCDPRAHDCEQGEDARQLELFADEQSICSYCWSAGRHASWCQRPLSRADERSGEHVIDCDVIDCADVIDVDAVDSEAA